MMQDRGKTERHNENGGEMERTNLRQTHVAGNIEREWRGRERS